MMTKTTRAVLLALLAFCASLALLFVAYPWSTSVRNSTNSVGITLEAYLLVAAASGTLTLFLAGRLSEHSNMNASVQGGLLGVSTLAILAAASIIFGPVGYELPGMRVRWMFFSEWQFLVFDGYVALPLAVIDSAAAWFLLRTRKRTRSLLQ
jgi:hypothetical protein